MTTLFLEALIRKHLADPQFCVKRLALMLRISTSHLRKIVHQLSHTSPQKLIEEIRMRLAVQMLEQQFKIHTIARTVGYNSDRAFRAAFRRWQGSSPIEYKKMARAQ